METSPRILLTGFSSFPGVPANPTEALVEALRADPGLLAGIGDVHLAVLPDIALHFGVSRRARAFTIETVARNAVCTKRPDNAGHVPVEAWVRVSGNDVVSTLPVGAIQNALIGCGLPAVFSDDAGDYLCNSLFYLSAGGFCPAFAPERAGFIHVPPFGTVLNGGAGKFDLRRLLEGAGAICRACVDAWGADTRKAAERSRDRIA